MKKLIFTGIALATVLSLSTAGAQTLGQDVHGVGHDTANAGRTVGHDTAHGTKVATRDTVHGTKEGAHKTARATSTGYHKTVRGTKRTTREVEGKPANRPQ